MQEEKFGRMSVNNDEQTTVPLIAEKLMTGEFNLKSAVGLLELAV